MQRSDTAAAVLVDEWMIRNTVDHILHRMVNTLIAAQDVAARKQAEEALRQYAEELLRSNAELEQFASVASHDLQEPLSMVTGYIHLLAQRYRGQLDPHADEFIDHAVEGLERMRTLIRDLLEYARVSAQGKPCEVTDSCEAVLQALANLRMATHMAMAEVTFDPLPVVVADRSQLVQVFQNLVANALKFHGETPPRVHISASLDDQYWKFSVQDNGIGIEPQNAERIFAIFQRLHTTAEYPGTGIGLAICKKVIERHGGQMWVESSLGDGATFFFTLPVNAKS